jgi:DNA uptake protein ComE-like DNA-binding protein
LLTERRRVTQTVNINSASLMRAEALPAEYAAAAQKQ